MQSSCFLNLCLPLRLRQKSVVLLQTTANTMREQLEQHRKASATLKANISALESKVAEALNKKETLKARAASAQVRLQAIAQARA